MRILSLWLAFVCLTGFVQGGESQANGPLNTVQTYVDSFNEGDVEGMVKAFASPGFILDGMSPHVWQGPDAAREWYQAASDDSKQHGVTELLISIGQPKHLDVTGDYAYVVVPASFSYKIENKSVRQTGAYFTVALKQTNGRWLIASWAWTKGDTKS